MDRLLSHFTSSQYQLLLSSPTPSSSEFTPSSRKSRPRLLAIFLFGIVVAGLGLGGKEVSRKREQYRLQMLEDAVDRRSTLDFVFAFGDSYTDTGYSPHQDVLNPFNHLRGWGATNGETWIQHLSHTHQSTASSYFVLAQSGATINNSIVEHSVPSFADQVSIFEDVFVRDNPVDWTGANSIFAIWFGVNDVGVPFRNNESFVKLVPEMVESYSRSIGKLYELGARNFLLLTIPPTQYAPLIASYGIEGQSTVKIYTKLLNSALATLWESIPTSFPGSEVLVLDAGGIMEHILNEPAQYGFMDTENFCEPYSRVVNHPSMNVPECLFPLRKFVWGDWYHPTWRVHEIWGQAGELLIRNSTIWKDW